MKRRRSALGKLGLDALLSSSQRRMSADENEWEFKHVAVANITPNPYQPRYKVATSNIGELAASIKKRGVLQPLLVCPGKNGNYGLIAGERRLRAAKLAGRETVPVVIKEATEQELAALSIVENAQRKNLDVLEEARSYQKLKEEFNFTQKDVAELSGRSRPAVANILRLLELAPGAIKLLREKKLEMGHARALLRLPQERQEAAAEKTVNKGMSVRQCETFVAACLRPAPSPRAESFDDAATETRSLERELSDILGAPVNIRHKKNSSGKLVIRYSDLEVLEGILEKLRRS